MKVQKGTERPSAATKASSGKLDLAYPTPLWHSTVEPWKNHGIHEKRKTGEGQRAQREEDLRSHEPPDSPRPRVGRVKWAWSLCALFAMWSNGTHAIFSRVSWLSLGCPPNQQLGHAQRAVMRESMSRARRIQPLVAKRFNCRSRWTSQAGGGGTAILGNRILNSRRCSPSIRHGGASCIACNTPCRS